MYLGFAPDEMPGLLPADLETPAALTTLRFSSHGYATRPTDSPANTRYPALLARGFSFSREAPLGIGGAALAPLSFGTVQLFDDGYAGGLAEAYGIDGREVRIRRGTPGRVGSWPALADCPLAWTGTAGGWRRAEGRVDIVLRDALHLLEVPLHVSRYGGAGGTDGGADLRDRVIPISVGYSRNVAPVLVDAATQTYQVHFRSIRAVRPKVRGVPQTLVASAPAAGQYSQDLANGRFTLGAQPDGPVTAEVEGDDQGGYAYTTAGCIRRICEIAGLSALLDDTAMAALEAAAPGEVGLHLAEPLTVLEAAERLTSGVGGYLSANRANRLAPGVLSAPRATAAGTLRAGDILAIAPLAMPAGVWPAVKRVRVAYAPNGAPTPDLADNGVSADDRAYLPLGGLEALSDLDAAIAAAHALAQEPAAVPGLYRYQADAKARADALLAFWRRCRGFAVTTRKYLGQVEVGHTFRLTHPDFGLAGGWSGVVQRWAEDMDDGTVTLNVIGP